METMSEDGLGARLGGRYLGGGRCRFLVWAPNAHDVSIQLTTPERREALLIAEDRGYFSAEVENVEPGARYFVALDGQQYPDPVSRSQPEGVHGPSEIVDDSFDWTDNAWTGLPLDAYVVYELHVGTFTPEGTFDAVIPHLDPLAELGVTAVETMPVAQFPGARNWGYDGVDLFAVQNSYGGPDGLKRLVNACHERNLAVILDVVYNHLGPEGNYLARFGPYFTDEYHTPWGAAINFDGAHSDEVRAFFFENARHWFEDFHVDALRLDAIHAIHDRSAYPFLRELADRKNVIQSRLNRDIYLMPESDLNDPRVVTPPELGGFGHDAQWSDDFHHAVHALLTGENGGYYADFGAVRHAAAAYENAYCYTGEYSVYRKRRHGANTAHLPASSFVVFSQNHDQVGNRAFGDRLNTTVGFEALKVGAAAVILSPYIPLLFMGQEYGETAPFLFFTDHGDAELRDAVRRGRMEEFAAFDWQDTPPDPNDEQTFQAAKLNHALKTESPHREILAFTKRMLALRREEAPLAVLSNKHMQVQAFEGERVLSVRRWNNGVHILSVLGFNDEPVEVPLQPAGNDWRLLLNSADTQWAGPGPDVSARLNLDGGFTLRVPSHAALVYKRAGEPS